MHRRQRYLRKHLIHYAAVLVSLLSFGAGARADNWSRFRGPNGQGLSDATTIPVRWSEQDYAWKIALPGEGHSSPVVWGDKVFVTCADSRAMQGIVLCVNASDGRELWRKAYPLEKVAMNSLNSYASSTPALDAEQIYLFWPGAGETVLAALRHDGREVWDIELPAIEAKHGTGSSPIVVGENVILSREQDAKNGGNLPSLWLALGCKDGQVRWRYEHPQNANASYSTPCTYRDAQGREQLIFTSNSHGIAGVDPGTGALLWKTPEVLPARVVSSPVIAGQTIVGTCGEGARGIRLAAVQPPGGSSGARETYGLERGVVSYVPTAVAHDGLLFLFHDQGTVSCLRAGTGEVVWSEKPAGRYYGSPVCVDGKLYCQTIDGSVVVLQAGPKYELLSVNPLGEKTHATPAVANGRMYLRTFTHLICIGGQM